MTKPIDLDRSKQEILDEANRILKHPNPSDKQWFILAVKRYFKLEEKGKK